MSIKVVEVGPRDGLQNEPQSLDLENRVLFIQKLIDAGLQTIEGGSFVSSKAIPQMQDSEKVWERLKSEVLSKNVDLSFLVPNMKGLERALAVNIHSVAVFTATSEAFNQKNIGMSVEKSLEVISQIIQTLKSSGGAVRVRGYVSTVFGCPYEGAQSVSRAIQIIQELLNLGCYEVSVGDTIGVAHPKQVKDFLGELKKSVSLNQIALHMHDTRGAALANVQMGIEAGVRVFDSSIGGLGGCPYAQGSSGNLATEELVWLLEGYGFKTHISMEKLLETSKWIETKIARKLKSKLYLAEPKRFYFF